MNGKQEERRIQLTCAQQEAVESTQQNIAVIAGPGSGKTRVLTERIFHLVHELHVSERQILALSFSCKAAGEVAKRLRERMGNRAWGITASTFHSFGLRMIRSYADRLGLSENVEIVSPSTRYQIIGAALKRCMNAKAISQDEIQTAAQEISRIKNGLPVSNRTLYAICEAYNAELRRGNSVDFDDMIGLSRKLLSDHADIRAVYQNQYRHVLVDEVQDMSQYQTDIINLLVGKNTSLFVVGDDDQCIYEWRGAAPDYLKNLARNAEFQTIYLDDNFRSEGAIVQASAAFIDKNRNRIKKRMNTRKIKKSVASSATTHAYRLLNPDEEGRFIAQTIAEMVNNGAYDYGDFTVLVRKHSQTDPIRNALERVNIPVNVHADDTTYFDEFLRMLRAFSALTDKNNITRVINYPTKFMDNFLYEEICEKYPLVAKLPVQDGMRWLHENNCTFDDSDVFHSRYTMINAAYDTMDRLPLIQLLENFFCYYTEKEKPSLKTLKKLEQIQTAIDMAAQYEQTWHQENASGKEKLLQFLDHISLSEQDESSKAMDSQAVNIMTCHKSKGLEFPVVFIPGVQVSNSKQTAPFSFISSYFTTTQDLLEAERRLLYVSMTRAIDKLYITCSSDPFGGGFGESVIKCGFLAEIPDLVLKKVEIQKGEA